MRELGGFARRMHEGAKNRHGQCEECWEASMAESLALGTLGKVYYCRQPAGVQTQLLFPSLYLYFPTSPIL